MIEKEIIKQLSEDKGFVVAMDQSLSSAPNVLRNYGIPENTYFSEEEMLHLIHDMRTRIVTSPSFDSDYVLGIILYKDTLTRQINGQSVVDYLWEDKHVFPFIKVDEGLAPEENGVQLMAPMPHLNELLEEAKHSSIVGTKTRSVIKKADKESIEKVVAQQFELVKAINFHHLVPIIEPEISFHIPEKKLAEEYLKASLLHHLNQCDDNQVVMLKLALPETPDFYQELIQHPRVIRVLASSSGLKQTEADKKLMENHGLIASFSRALNEGLRYEQADMEFDFQLKETIQGIYDASII